MNHETPGAAQQTPPPQARTHLLVVDDDHQLASLLRQVLERAGHEVSLAHDGLEALNRYRQALADHAPYDLVMMDLHMPVMDGLECLDHLRDLDQDVPVLLFTGSPAEDLGDLARRVLGVVNKPVRIAPLLEKVEQALARTSRH